jgi:hypothetical protein
MSGLPKDEWVIHLPVDTGNRVVNTELVLEIHGPFVWELYDIIPPREYFGRYAGIVMVGDIVQEDSLRDLARFIEVFDSYGTSATPAVLVYESSGDQRRGGLCLARQAFTPRFVRLAGVDFRTGEGARRPLDWIVTRVLRLNPTADRQLE